MAEKDEGGKPSPEKGEGAEPEPAKALPGPAAIPEPEPAEETPPQALPVGESEQDSAEDSSASRVLELEGRLERRMRAGLDKEVEKGTEETLRGEIEQDIEGKLRQELELQVDREVGLQTRTDQPPKVVDLGARDEIPYATVLPPGPPEAPLPEEGPPGMPARKKVSRAAPLRNRQPPGRPAGDGDLSVAGRGPGLVNGRGLRNRRGLSNGVVNGTGLTNGARFQNGLANGAVNGQGAVNGLRNRRGMSNGNGITNGNGLAGGRRGALAGRLGRTNGGLTDAEASKNGRGMVNGRGIINGEGVTNGREAGIVEAPPRRRPSGFMVFVAIGIALIVVVAGLYIVLSSAEKGIQVDGVFTDWAGTVKYPDDIADLDNPEVNIVDYALSVDGSSASVYIRTEGRALGGRDGGVDSAFFFFDTDRDPSTGYRIDSAGAELVLVVDGYEGRVSAAGLYRFPREGPRPGNDWNSRTATGACRAAVSGSELEAQLTIADLGGGSSPKFNLLVCMKDSSGALDMAPVIGTDRARLTALWSRAGPPRADAGASAVPLLRLELGASGGNTTVSSLTVHASEALLDGDLSRIYVKTAAGFELPGAVGHLSGGRAALAFTPPLAVPAGGTVVLTVLGDLAPSAGAGKAVGLSIEGGQDIAAGTRALSVESGSADLTYVGTAPAGIVIDGAFLDWEAVPDNADPAGDVPDPNIDVTGFRAAADNRSLSVYLRVDGQIMGGRAIPEKKLRPPPNQHGTGPPAALPVVVGEDSAFVFVDADNDDSTGYAGAGLPPGADFLVNFTGRFGKIEHRALHRFSGSDRAAWSWTPLGDVEAATDATRLEARLALAALGSPAANVSLFYYTTNWRLDRDSGLRVALELAGGPGGRAAGDGAKTGEAPEPPASGRDIQPLHAPEFRDVLLPLAGMTVVFLVLRRRRAGRKPERRGP